MMNKTSALVTGATGDIGRVIVKELEKAGITVIPTSRTSGASNSGIYANLKFIDLVERVCDITRERVGCPDIIINCAGIFTYKPLEDITDEMIREDFAVNVFAPMRICRYFLPDMIKRKWGHIINICSITAYSGGGASGHCLYASTKHALLGFSRALDEEVRKHNIRVSSVSPAGVVSRMMEKRGEINRDSLVNPSDIAEAVMYLIASKGKGVVNEMRVERLYR